MPPETSPKPRVGIPYRTRKEELKNERESYQKYLAAALAAGAQPVEISLGLTPSQLTEKIRDLDAFILPGSPADVHPSLFRAAVHPNCSISDPCRESTDFAILAHAFQDQKPVLAICYGTQSLNVFLGGTLVQDIPSEVATKIQHPWTGHEGPEPHHHNFARGEFPPRPAGRRQRDSRQQFASPIRARVREKPSRRGACAGWRDRSD